MPDFLVTIIVAIGSVMFWVYKSVKDTIRAWRGRGVIYGIKILLARVQVLIVVVFGCYMWLICAFLTILLMNYTDKMVETMTPHIITSLISNGLPFVYAIGVIGLPLAIIFIGCKPVWKQSDEERKYEKELREIDKTKNTAKAMRYPRIIRWFLLN
jgi:predicted membrane protein